MDVRGASAEGVHVAVHNKQRRQHVRCFTRPSWSSFRL